METQKAAQFVDSEKKTFFPKGGSPTNVGWISASKVASNISEIILESKSDKLLRAFDQDFGFIGGVGENLICGF